MFSRFAFNQDLYNFHSATANFKFKFDEHKPYRCSLPAATPNQPFYTQQIVVVVSGNSTQLIAHNYN